MSYIDASPKQKKVCFVTIGATAGFDSLIQATLQPAFLTTLRNHGYTDLRLQHGKDGRTRLEEFKRREASEGNKAPVIRVSGFDFNKHGLGAEMRAAKAGPDSLEGVVISHAGMVTLMVLDITSTHICIRNRIYS